jgi:uncharacterized protein YqhQ
MSDKGPRPDDRTQYGGQAVVEGVMMRSPRYFAIACRRRSNGEIVVKLEHVNSILPAWLKWLNKPFLRGTAALVDAMAMGIRSLTYAANLQLEDEQTSQPAESLAEPIQESNAASAVNLAMGEGGPVLKNGAKPAGSSIVNQSVNGIAIGATTVLALLLGFALFWLIPRQVSVSAFHIHNAFASSLTEGLIRLVIFFVYLGLVSRMAHVQRVFEYHGAEHKAINALEAMLPLTVENAKTVSRIHPRCGTNFIFIVLITAVPIFAIIPPSWPIVVTHLARLVLLPIVAGVAFEILKFAGVHRDKKWAMVLIAPGLWTQYITTREPDDSQIEVAIKSLQAVWDKEHEASAEGEADVAAAVA